MCLPRTIRGKGETYAFPVDLGLNQLLVWSNYSCGVSVILQQSAEPLPTAYAAAGPVLAGFLGREQEGVALPLVVPLVMIMINKIGKRASQRGFTKQLRPNILT